MASPPPPTLADRFDQTVFNAVYSRALVYNACWEDPAVDRRALCLGPDDTLPVIASASCKVPDYVMRRLPVSTNHFWSVCIRGRYADGCCPEYLKADDFAALKAGLCDRIHLHTSTVTEFLQDNALPISRFVLLDHMVWMSPYYPQALAAEWRYILRRATPDARVVLRGAHAAAALLERPEPGDGLGALRERLLFHPALAAELQRRDRVRTRAGLHVVDVRP